MGTSGTDIFSDDLAADVRDRALVLIDAGGDLEQWDEGGDRAAAGA